jgi:hypothetical protein
LIWAIQPDRHKKERIMDILKWRTSYETGIPSMEA